MKLFNKLPSLKTEIADETPSLVSKLPAKVEAFLTTAPLVKTKHAVSDPDTASKQ